VRDYLQAFSPICPFFTHYLSTTLYGESAVDACHFPKLIGINDELLSLTEPIMNFNSIVWKTKKEMGISLNSEIQGMNIPAELENFSVQLTNMHKLIS
jgi:valyl-tRNA synthetase